MHNIYEESYWKLFEALDHPLLTRSPDSLHEIARPFIPAASRILDAGCRDAAHLVRLVNEHHATGVGLDPVEWHISRARAKVQEARIESRIELVKGVMEEMPFSGTSFDFVWCRDVLEVVEPLKPALAEAQRVLKPDGYMLVYTNFATQLLAPHEMTILEALGNLKASMDQNIVEAAFKAAGFSVVSHQVIGTEWREHDEPLSHIASRDLLRLARLRRQRPQIIDTYGENTYKTAEASTQWLIFQFLGKLQPVVYVLKNAG